VGTQVGQDYPTAGLPDLPANSCQNQAGTAICGGTLFNPNGSPPEPSPQPQPDIPTNLPRVSPLLNIAAQFTNNTLTEKKQDEVINTQQGGAAGGTGGPSGQKGGGGNAGRPPVNVVPPPGLGPLPSGMPPVNETRFASNEVVMQLGLVLSQEQIEALQRQFGLEVISTQRFDLLGRTVFRFRITGGLDVRAVIAGVQNQIGSRISLQPSYAFELVQGTAPAPAAQSSGDSAQYIVAKLGLVEAHGIATGKNVKIAVIDSEIDSQHPDLAGVIKGSFDALPSSDQTPHPHGTGMAGAIGSHQRLLGIAPGANILGVRAFGVSDSGAQGTSMNIVKGLEWAVQQGAQVINMSFAGPRDPILEQAIKALKDRGVILIAATGNAGPKSPPLFPGADANVIGVSATDQDDKTYKNAVRGKQVAIAAPGVDILVPAPAGGYQLTTGTSVAAAHISGVVALMLERNPRLTPAEVRAILSTTAKKLPQGRNEIGAGLVDPVQALSKAGPKQAQAH
jgi:subtilisin family serine protease